MLTYVIAACQSTRLNGAALLPELSSHAGTLSEISCKIAQEFYIATSLPHFWEKNNPLTRVRISMTKEIFSHYSNQLSFDYEEEATEASRLDGRDALVQLLTEDLDFHRHSSTYATHNFHAFPAKFPPQLPSKFIQSLTQPGDVVLDPMMGSGTTVLEAFLAGRRAIGFDIDPLAVMSTRVKTTRFPVRELGRQCKTLVLQAKNRLQREPDRLRVLVAERWDAKTKEFVDYWFAPQTQLELMALLLEIATVPQEKLRIFFELALSATIITKSGGVSLALDLAHTRPHKAKVIIAPDGTVLSNEMTEETPAHRLKVHTKKLRSAIDEFEKRCLQNIESLIASRLGQVEANVAFGNAQALPLQSDSVDLIVTSPPYASNAIDYMRAHKFSLVWLGYPIQDLSHKRKKYIGSEDTLEVQFEDLPPQTLEIVNEVASADPRRGKVLHRYYSEMRRVLAEMFRVLKPGKAAIVVVGNSVMRGKDTQTPNCLAEIGKSLGFDVPKIGVRNLDRNKRMMPAGSTVDTNSQIQQRMHVEYVIGFYKKGRRLRDISDLPFDLAI